MSAGMTAMATLAQLVRFTTKSSPPTQSHAKSRRARRRPTPFKGKLDIAIFGCISSPSSSHTDGLGGADGVVRRTAHQAAAAAAAAVGGGFG